jgi:hypothetical protein
VNAPRRRTFSVGGLTMPVPPGWEARGVGEAQVRQADGSVAYPFVHLASFAMNAVRAPYGSGVVEYMGADDAFVALLEFAPQSATTALFARHGPPRRLRATDFSPSRLQRTIKGQLGAQVFFRENGRAFCCYVVLGGIEALRVALGDVNAVLSGLEIRATAVLR